MAYDLALKCGSCDKDAIFLDLAGINEAYPYCASCLGEELLVLELEKRRIIPTYEWDEWQKDHPGFRLVT